MAEKVKLTQEQVDAIERILAKHHKKDCLLIEHSKFGGFTLLNKLEIDLPLLARALYIGYEVEPKFKVGDWVICEDGYIGEIEFINELEGWSNIGWSKETKEKGVCLAATYDLIDIVRHATPEEIAKEKERRWWKEHGREVWELKVCDLLKSIDEGHVVEVRAVDTKGNPLFYGGNVYSNLDYVKDNYKISCFSEDRKDVK